MARKLIRDLISRMDSATIHDAVAFKQQLEKLIKDRGLGVSPIVISAFKSPTPEDLAQLDDQELLEFYRLFSEITQERLKQIANRALLSAKPGTIVFHKNTQARTKWGCGPVKVIDNTPRGSNQSILVLRLHIRKAQTEERVPVTELFFLDQTKAKIAALQTPTNMMPDGGEGWVLWDEGDNFSPYWYRGGLVNWTKPILREHREPRNAFEKFAHDRIRNLSQDNDKLAIDDEDYAWCKHQYEHIIGREVEVDLFTEKLVPQNTLKEFLSDLRFRFHGAYEATEDEKEMKKLLGPEWRKPTPHKSRSDVKQRSVVAIRFDDAYNTVRELTPSELKRVMFVPDEAIGDVISKMKKKF